MVIYISGKITGIPDLNKPMFNGHELLWRDRGYTVINPHTICLDIDPKSPWQVFMRRCIERMMMADMVAVLDDFRESRGAMIEVLIALFLGIPVVVSNVYLRYNVFEQVTLSELEFSLAMQYAKEEKILMDLKKIAV